MKVRSVWTFLRESYSEFSEDNASLFGAALAYYTFFSLAPLLLIAIAVAGFVFGTETARGEVVSQLRHLIGDEAAAAVRTLLVRAGDREGGLVASAIGVATVVFGSTRVFTNLQTALNVMWGVETEEKGGIRASVKQMARKRAVSFLMVLAVGFLLLVLLLVSASVSVVENYLGALAWEPAQMLFYHASELVVSFAIVTAVLAVIYKFLPDTSIEWRDVWFGAVATAFLFTIGKFLIGWYLGSRSIGSVFGAAGSLVIVLLWVYYSSQILLFGAEMTQVFARRFGSRSAGRSDSLGESPERASRSTP